MDLRQLQALFLDTIVYPTGVDDFLAQADEDARAAFSEHFVSTPQFSSRKRLSVYAESYFWRLADVLGDQFRVVAWLAGPRHFHNLVTDYVLQRPSKSPDLRRFGRDLPEFIAQHPIATRIPDIDRLALVERSIVEAIDMPDQPCIDESALHGRPLDSWPAMRLVPAPWVRLWATARSYPELFEARRSEVPSPATVPPLDGATHHVLVWRQDTEVCHRSVRPAEARALDAVLATQSFEQICLAAARSETDDAAGPEQVVQWLRGWLVAGLLVDVRST